MRLSQGCGIPVVYGILVFGESVEYVVFGRVRGLPEPEYHLEYHTRKNETSVFSTFGLELSELHHKRRAMPTVGAPAHPVQPPPGPAPVGSQRKICRSAWDAVPGQAKAKPFISVVWEGFMPVQPPAVEPDQMQLMPNPKLGKARCIFDGSVYTRMPSTRMIDLFLGSAPDSKGTKVRASDPAGQV